MEELVIIDKKINNDVEKLKRREKIIPFPELNGLMGLGEGQTAAIKIRQLELSEYMLIKGDVNNFAITLVEEIVAAATKKGEVEKVITDYMGQSPEVKFRQEILKVAILEPKLNGSTIQWLCKMYPMAIMRVIDEIMKITNQGGELKKNG